MLPAGDYSKWSLAASTLAINWRSPVAPAGPAFAGSYPFIVSRSYVELKASTIKFVNVQVIIQTMLFLPSRLHEERAPDTHHVSVASTALHTNSCADSQAWGAALAADLYAP